MYGKVKNIWDIKANGGGSSIDTENFASKIKANTFTQKNTFENTGNVINIKTTDDQAFGITFKNNSNETVGYVGTKVDGNEQKAHLHGYLGLSLETPNKDININSGSGHLLSNSSKSWNEYLDNSILRQKDTKWVRIVEQTTVNIQPNTNWNWTAWGWDVANLTSTTGIIELIVGFFFPSNNFLSFRVSIPWKVNAHVSKAPIQQLEYSGRIYSFQVEVKPNRINVFHKHDNGASGGNISSIRVWTKRGVGLPDKVDNLW